MTGESYLSHHSPVLQFGLGGASRADAIHVIWPDGARQTVRGVPADRRLRISRGPGDADYDPSLDVALERPRQAIPISTPSASRPTEAANR